MYDDRTPLRRLSGSHANAIGRGKTRDHFLKIGEIVVLLQDILKCASSAGVNNGERYPKTGLFPVSIVLVP